MKSISLACVVFGLVVVARGADTPATSPAAGNWPQWRGPLANGVAPLGNPPLNWDENTNIRWKVKIPGHSTATPIIWGDQIFLPTAIETDRQAEPDDDAPAEKSAAISKPEAPVKPDASAKDESPAAKDAPPADTPPAKGGGRRGGRANPRRPNHYYQFVVLSVDRRTGQTLWQHLAKEAVPHEGHHPDGSYASASPTTDGHRLYVSFGSRGVYCYDLAGQPIWSRDLGRMKVFNTFGEGTSPVLHGDALIVNWDHLDGSFIFCLDAATGETRWKVAREEGSTWATPLVVEHGGVTQVIVHGTTRVRSYDLKTGELIWACGGQAPSAIPSPVTDGELAFAMAGFIGNSLYAIPLDAKGDITKEDDKIAWKRKQPGTPYVPSPILYGDLLYFTGNNRGVLTCLNAKTGEPVFERKRLEGIENIYASPVGAADRIYFTGREGNTVVIKRGGDLDILATNKLDDRFDASAAIVGNEIFLRGSDNLYCIAAP